MEIVTNILITLFICTLVKISYTEADILDYEENKCGSGKFECKDGQCIANWNLCNGRAQCNDQSDETEEECRKPWITCSAYAFRCAYGACVDANALCNGVRDCIDNSDETLPRCNNTSTTPSCRADDQFKCKNNKCIDKKNLCDGNAHCTDRSDETVEECASISCPETAFRCAYGACVNVTAKCDGVANCADGSDEDRNLCKSTTPKPTIRSCTVPEQPTNGRWELHTSQCPPYEHCSIESGINELQLGSALVYTCNAGYKLDGSAEVYCTVNGNWSSSPKCVEVKCRPLSSASVNVECSYKERYVSCDSSVPPQTKAKVTCKNAYQEDRNFYASKLQDWITCNKDGKWEPDPIRCVPVCGVVRTNAVPLIVNGTSPNITEFPWHATLYRAESSSEPKKFICGATIIQDKLLITAAHCVYDEVKQIIQEPEKFYVAAGNYFRDYDSPLHDERVVNKRRVKSIRVPCSYLGYRGNYGSDIAILEVDKPFVLTAVLAPVCLDASALSDQAVLEPDSYGKLARFETGQSSGSAKFLRVVTVPYVPFAECRSHANAYDASQYLTMDKFCGGVPNGSEICAGDSGSGLSFKTSGLWYLRGVLSVSGLSNNYRTSMCDDVTHAFYTRISSHIAWIIDTSKKLIIGYGSARSCPTS